AVPENHVERKQPTPGDVVVLLGGKTGRDGCGGATGSSKSHDVSSLEECGAEVQKGNAPEERKLQRLFRKGEVTRLIKRCNDFGAGGVSVAIGELADGLEIQLDAVPKKYEGLDGTELAISESQERMAVVVAAENLEEFLGYAKEENLEATPVAKVSENRRLKMTWRDTQIVDLSRDFLDSNGAEKHIKVQVAPAASWEPKADKTSLQSHLEELVKDLNVCSKKGLSERFDSTIGANTVLMPFGGKYQMTPTQAMAAKLPVLHGNSDDCSIMAYGYNPYLTEASPYHGSYIAVAESVAKVIAAGGSRKACWLSFQEYFEKLGTDPKRWGKPLAALLGALDAQIDLEAGAIGGKDSMSGSFEDIHVPPTLVSFAVSMSKGDTVISPEFKKVGSRVVLLAPVVNDKGLPEGESLRNCLDLAEALIHDKKVLSAYVPSFGGISEALFKMTLGNQIGFTLHPDIDKARLYDCPRASLILELAEDMDIGEWIGTTTEAFSFTAGDECVDLRAIQEIYENQLKPVYPYGKKDRTETDAFHFEVSHWQSPRQGAGKPKVFIPVFPGTNCEYDTARALERAGADPQIFVIRNLSKEDIMESLQEGAKLLNQCQMMVIPGGFSGGDEPDGSGKFITAFFRNPRMADCVHELLFNRDGLVCGICNGFQALIKLGLVPYGRIVDVGPDCPTLTFNQIGRHQSMLVRTRVASNKSPWLMGSKPGDIHTIPISHGEGRFVAPIGFLNEMARHGQIATQYVDLNGDPTMDERFNPNGSLYAIEGITSPDGRVLGKMGHSERISANTYKNVDGEKDQKLFENAVRYFSL
ncbi:MAG: phosphoribosylformylglycinamidine synthase, partial [Firmicutes bacterium]|nr:phosphoribosylformylglycinamidine synthase [Bacillota bacterium]